MEQSVFKDEWRRCLKEHYKHVIRHQDSTTQRTLVPVLHRLGFTDDDLRQLYVEATMRADDMPDDFVPEMPPAAQESVDDAPEPAPVAAPHPAECTCDACSMDTLLEQGHDDEGQPLPDEEPEEVQVHEADASGKLFPGVSLPDAEQEHEDDINDEIVADENGGENDDDEAGDDDPQQMSLF